jgi:hypothetical protein
MASPIFEWLVGKHRPEAEPAAEPADSGLAKAEA